MNARIITSCLIAALIASILSGVLVMDRALIVTVDMLAGQFPGTQQTAIRRCMQAPSSFESREILGLQGFAYNLETGVSLNPRAPRLDPQLQGTAQSGQLRSARFFWSGDLGGGFVVRTGAPGPCSLFQVVWPFKWGRRLRMLSGVGLASAAISTLAIVLCYVLALRPLMARIERTADAAAAIGDESAFPGQAPRLEDAITRIYRSMERAHGRIIQHQKQLQYRQQRTLRTLADLAHDIRTPLASIQLALDQAQRSCPMEDSSGSLMVELAVEELEYLSGLVEDLQLASELREGLNPLMGNARVDLGAVLDRVSLRGRIIGRAQAIQVEAARPDAAVWVDCHPLLAERLVSNLVRNAIVHGIRGGHVALSVDTHGERFRLTVLDDGPGIPPEEIPHLTERHFTGNTPRADSGSGLGLAIVGEICSRVNWSLAFAAAAPQGLRVVITGRLAGRSAESG